MLIVLALGGNALLQRGQPMTEQQQREKYQRNFLGKQSDQEELPTLTTRRRLILGVFVLSFLALIYAVIPWSDLGITFFPTLGWWFGELAALFLVSAVIIGLIAGYNDQELLTEGRSRLLGCYEMRYKANL